MDTGLSIVLRREDYLAIAFNVSPKQIIGPDWIDEVRFDVNATITAGVSRDEFPTMLDQDSGNPVGPVLEAAVLALDSRRAPLDVIVIDSMLRIPTENSRTVFIRAIDSVSVNTQPFHVVNQSGSPSDREGSDPCLHTTVPGRTRESRDANHEDSVRNRPARADAGVGVGAIRDDPGDGE
jgi:hypothetical protein